MELGEVLKKFRIDKGLTQIQVSAKTSISQTFLSQVESGSKSPSKAMLKKLCDIYGVPPIIVLWMSVTEADIQKKKLPAYRAIKPAIDGIIEQFLSY